MKYMNKKEIEVFANKYFKGFEKDIRSVSYFVYDNKIEYLVNEHYLIVKELA